MKHPLLAVTTVAALLSLASCSTTQYDTPSSDLSALGRSGTRAAAGSFPRPPELEPQVNFWRNVYARWSRSQVALHDDRHLNLVYEVIDLPDEIYEGYTTEQQDYARERRELLQYRLQELERKTLAQEPLTPAEQALASQITAAAGPQAVYGASERVRSQRGLRERFKRGLEISGRYDALFKQIFRQAGLPEDLAYLPHVESSFQAQARSSAGAVGIWQFTRPAARTYMTNHPALDERLDPVASARGAARYLSHAYSLLGNWSLAVTSYNHGIGGMSRARDQYGTDFVKILNYYDGPQFGFASRNFYAEFLAARDIASQPRRFFPEGIRYEAPLSWEQVVLVEDMPVSALARYYGVDSQVLIAMNAAWTPAAHSERVALPAGVEIWLPPGTLNRVAQLHKAPERSLVLADYPEPPEKPVQEKDK